MFRKIGLSLMFFVIAIITGMVFVLSLSRINASQTSVAVKSTEKIEQLPPEPLQAESIEAEQNTKIEEVSTNEMLAKTEIIENETEEQKTKPFSFVVISDAENYNRQTRYNDELEPVLAKAASYKPDFALFLGDLLASDSPNENRLINLKKLIEKYYEKYYHTFGKHDIECGVKCIDAWQEVFYGKKYKTNDERNLYYSFDYENTHFVLLSTDYPIKHSIDDKQLKWLDEDLSKTNKDHIIVSTHVPPINFFEKSAKECHDMSCSEQQRVKLMSVLLKHRVDLVISGHEHVFDHKIVGGIDFVIAGNTGNGKRYKDSTWETSFSIINVTKYAINLKALGADGHLIREIKIK